MPLYEYRCDECDTRVDLIRGIDDRDDIAWCMECEIPMDRVICAPSIHYKWGEGSEYGKWDKKVRGDSDDYM